ncbi:SapC family protein [Sphingomicrobium clamense]|uniref:SapC family protein n=1 Tax=Sphingomicrobium clamense TaxID=2851013 RepID=A0ABS6V2B6_9SPHN|nr:SapC family protein [Sphingomicrobium sp. B8]MBW0143697.1 SapC family protein [Sphingomicrobium sp. B8]
MANHVIVDSNTHRDLKIDLGFGEELGDKVMSAFVVPEEFRSVQADYPILFRKDLESEEFAAVALFGFEQDENLFLEGNRWDAPRRPLSMEVQPFLIGRPADGDGPGQVHIDMDHPRTGAEDGQPLFDADGKPTDYLDDMAGKLGALDQGFRASAGFFDALKRYELLEPFTLEVSLADGSKNNLVGFHILNDDKVAALPSGALGELHEAGYLLPIYMALASLSQLQALVDRKSKRMGLG